MGGAAERLTLCEADTREGAAEAALVVNDAPVDVSEAVPTCN